MTVRIALASLFALFLTASCAPRGEIALPCSDKVGAICADGKALSFDQMVERLATADIVILGEQHTNPAHHEWQARIVSALHPRGLAFEMIPRAKEETANAARARGEDIGAALDWASSGWPDFALYRPIFEAAPDARIAGGGVARDVLRRAMTKGAGAAAGPEAARYRLDERLAEHVIDAMIEEQATAHCGVLPPEMLPGMVEAQQLRDVAFADAALRLVEGGHGPAVLITGNGHARTDRGAPFYLRRAVPERVVLSVGMIEAGAVSETPFDITLRTAPSDQGDPCAALREKFGKT